MGDGGGDVGVEALVKTAWLATCLFAAPCCAFAQDDWRDTHRVILRNGHTVDGVLSEDSTLELIIIQFSPTAQLGIKSLDIDRIEEIKLRQHGSDRKKLELRLAEAAANAAKTNTPTDIARTDPTPQLEFDSFKSSAILQQIKPEIRSQVDKWIQQLGIVDDKEAKDAIVKLGSGAVLYAASRLPTLQPIVVNRVVEVLLTSRDKQLPTILRPMMTGPNDDLAATVMRTLAKLQDKGAVDAFRKLCAHPSLKIRQEAAQGIADMGTASDFPLLISLVTSEDSKTRTIGARTLSNASKRLNRNAAAVEALRACLSRTDADRADGIVSALSFIRCPESIDVLRKLLQNPSADIRGAAAKGLGDSMAAKAVPDLHDMISREKDSAAKMEAARALMMIKDESSTKPLIAAMALERDPDVLDAIQKALARITGKTFEAKYDRWKKWLDTGK
jgi:HEAT repeat protein